ncbi:MAG: hypothetical protein M0Z55_08690 [Peptococcaceae bacterium]|nr:hypothetical protein [Peptococcaceae bacterium]
MSHWRRTGIIALSSLLGIILLAGAILFFSLPSLAAPISPIPLANQAQNQIALQNITTKLRSATLGLLTSRDGTLRLTLSENELNAVTYQALKSAIHGDITLLGTTTKITPEKRIVTDCALKWHGYTLGFHVNIKPVVLPNGTLALLPDELKLGRIPLPKNMVLEQLKPYLPQATTLIQQPAGILFNPNGLINGNYPAIIKDPRIGIKGLNFGSHSVQIAALVSFRLF